jgi:hypothetical protein
MAFEVGQKVALTWDGKAFMNMIVDVVAISSETEGY